MFGINYKNWIKEGVDSKVDEYLKWLDAKPCWSDIEIGYVPADHEAFMNLHINHKCKHPKELYRPGNTVICHFTPISKDLAAKYNDGEMSQKEWDKLCIDTRQISRGITDAIIETLRGFGREAALLTEREGWSHSCGAEAAGMGKFGYKEEMFCSETQIGFLGSMITEVEIK